MNARPGPRELTADDIIRELEGFTPNGSGGGLVFDADGTLWSGDVGEEVFEAAIRDDLLRVEATPRLRQEAEEFSLATDGGPAELASRLLQAYRAGTYPELRACELMVWCYAGWTEAQLRTYVRRTLAREVSRVSHYLPLRPIQDWARARGVRCIIISASPKLVVEEAAAELGFGAPDVVGGRSTVLAGRLQPTLETSIPYAQSKADAGRALLQADEWLATFGDNVFDLEMLQEARLGVAVRPKRRLLDALHELGHVALFREHAQS